MGAYIQYDEGAWKWDPYLDVPKNWKDTREFPRKEKPVTEKEKFDKFNEEVIEELNKLEKRRSKKKPKTDKPKKSASPLVIEFGAMPDKAPRQMKIILTKLKELGRGVPYEELCLKLVGVLPTKQPVEKVYKHYHREMVDKGYIRVLS
jgi:hypothetical protein